ncbi:MAG: hypothetical protein OXM61_16565 [Candidatus Poribacteria bacterium]|nr:hypothetical protein [Candidatus Poribacteria bacterium]
MKDTTFMPKQNFNEKLIALLKTKHDFVDESDELLPSQANTTHDISTVTLANVAY